MIERRQKFEYQGKVLIERVTITPPFRYEAVFQNEGCFIYIKGAGPNVISLDGNQEIKNQEAILFKCGVFFVDWLKKAETAIEIIAFHLYPDILRELYKNELPKQMKTQSRESDFKKIVPENTITKFVDSLEFYFQHPSIVSDDLLELKIKELILLLIQTKNADSVLELISDLFSPRKANLKRVVDSHLYSNLSVEELAKLCNLSVSAFKREFSREFNDSPKNYINQERIKKAKELLCLSELSVNEIAYRTGFNDPLYFIRLFKKYAGSPPGSFRSRNKI